ncbi:MAG: hypothetical protein MK078_14890 [Crocinitomicaceae bacterium]|nr:hypothetical protein [Crocinitomicaceae bacterium]
MKNLILFGLGIISLFLFSSCKKGGFKTSSDRIMGEWYFEKVRFQEGGTFRNKNITEEFENITVEFTSEFEYIETNGTDGTVRNGTWEINRTSTYYGDEVGNISSEVMTFPILDPVSGLIDFVQWEDLRIQRNRIQAIENKTGGRFQYFLRRL